jgi:hypothetical protein
MLSDPPEVTDPQIPCSLPKGVSISQVRRHGHDFGFELGGARPQVGVQLIALRLQRVHAIEKSDVLVVAVINRAGGEPAFPSRALEPFELLHLAEDGRPVEAARRKF